RRVHRPPHGRHRSSSRSVRARSDQPRGSRVGESTSTCSFRIAAVQSWNLREIDAPGGSRSPVVLRSDAAARAVLIALDPGQELGDHQVKERALVAVVDGSIRVESGGESVQGGTGCFFSFDADERRSISTREGARILLVLAPWPGAGPYRGDRSG